MSYDGKAAEPIPWQLLVQAKRWMRRGLDLYEAAHLIRRRPSDLDVALWNHFGEDAFE